MKERKFRSVGIFEKFRLVVGAALLTAVSTAFGQAGPDSGLPAYAKSGAISGTLRAGGSESMEEVLELWQAEFARLNAGAVVQRDLAGSSTAPPLLQGGQIQLAAMSRPMTDAELDSFAKAKGYKPTQVPVCLDALVVVVRKENPIRGLTLKELDGIFSSTRRSGATPVKTWGDLGLTDTWNTTAVAPVGRDAVSGTHQMFRQAALAGGDLHDGVSIFPGPRSAVRAVAAAEGGIGYAGFAALTNRVKALPLGRSSDALVAPSNTTVADGSYPLARTLYFYVDRRPGQPLDPLTAEFLRFVLAREGQALLARAGLIPLPVATVQSTRTQLF